MQRVALSLRAILDNSLIISKLNQGDLAHRLHFSGQAEIRVTQELFAA
jgi:hypothetical protein